VTTAADPIDQLVRVDEVAEAEFYAGDLFRRQFGGDPPDYPKHYVAWYRAGRNAYVVLGFLHCMVDGDLCLCGGLVEDERAIGRLPAPHQHALRASGGVAARLFDGAFARLASMPAFWAYVGDPGLRAIFRAARFEALDVAHLMVRWNTPLTQPAKDELIRRVAARGAF
jgi:hypothetical protein